MKKLMIGILVLGSFSSYAQYSEYQRGYDEGKRSCEEELWMCKSPYVLSEAYGKSRAAALVKLRDLDNGRFVVSNGLYTCEKL